MDCARNLGRLGNIWQGRRCFLVCDGHDRGLLPVAYSDLIFVEPPFVQTKVFTGAVPFSDQSPHAAMVAIAGGERPPRPTHPTLTDRLWTLTRRCWDQEADLTVCTATFFDLKNCKKNCKKWINFTIIFYTSKNKFHV